MTRQGLMKHTRLVLQPKTK